MEELTSGPQGEWLGGTASGSVAALDLTEVTSRPAFGTKDPDPLDPVMGPGSGADPERPPRIPFDRYVGEHTGRLPGTAYLLTGDRDAAEELVRRALAGAALGWVTSTAEPETDVLRVLARSWAGRWWWEWSAAAAAAPAMPERPADLLAGLDRLSRRQRVAVVLRYHHLLTEEATAAAVGAPVGNVRTWISQGLDLLAVDTRLDLRPEAGPGLSRAGLTAELTSLAAAGTAGSDDAAGSTTAGADEVSARLADVRARLPFLRRRARRRRIAGTLTASVAAVGLIAGALALAGPVPDPTSGAAAGSTVSGPIARGEQFDPRPPADPGVYRFERDLAGDPQLASQLGFPGQTEVLLRFVPTGAELGLATFCRLPGPAGLWMRRTLNGIDLDPVRCSESDRAAGSDGRLTTLDGPPGRAGPDGFGFRRGRESVLRLRLTTAAGSPADGGGVRMGAAVYELTGHRITSDGVQIKLAAEGALDDYRLAGHRTARITGKQRTVALTVPAGPDPVLVLYGIPGTRSRSTGVIPLTVNDARSLIVTTSGTATFTLSGDSGPHRLLLRARDDDTGVLLLAWYRLDK